MPAANKIGAMGIIACAMLTGGTGSKLLAATSGPAVVSTIDPAAAARVEPALPAVTNHSGRLPAQTGYVLLSPHLAEILRMVKARLDPEVIKTYIKSSNAAFSPSAADIVLLKRLQVPEDLITSMLERDGELRSKVGQSGRAAAGGSLSSPPMMPYAPYSTAYPATYPARPNYVYRYVPYNPAPLYFGPLTSFNNSYPTYINGQAVYTGYYAPYVF
jgi:hypothetical protein